MTVTDVAVDAHVLFSVQVVFTGLIADGPVLELTHGDSSMVFSR